MTSVRRKRLQGGALALKAHQDQIAKEFEKSGNNHWATEVDVTTLSKMLNVTIFIAANTHTQVTTLRGRRIAQ